MPGDLAATVDGLVPACVAAFFGIFGVLLAWSFMCGLLRKAVDAA